MNLEERRKPDEILLAIKKEEMEERKGRLKIFFGMSAGVGKTYAMLEEAQELLRAGVDVAVGVIDTHGRPETAALMDGLKSIPLRSVLYKGKEFKELDVDAIIQRDPQLVLVDELAHSNIPGLRHAKRWQDVIELLDKGIHVYTTLNVQHIESLNDLIKGITDISVRETVPDLVIERAAAIQVVDLTPDELLQRLKAGKVYLAGQSQVALLHFFQKDKLAALREISLRFAAEKVDRDLRKSSTTYEQQVTGRKSRDKLLVAVSPCPFSQKLIRTTKRWASATNFPWMAVYVNTGRTLDEEDSNQLAKNLQLARDLGAEIITVNNPNIADGIQSIVKERDITQIVIGRPYKSYFSFFKKNIILNRLSAECCNIDIHLIRQEPLKETAVKKNFSLPLPEQFLSYLMVLFCVSTLTALNWLFLPFIGYKIVGVIFLLGILSLSLFFKKGPILFASILYALAWNFFFLESVQPSNEDLALILIYVFTAISTGILVDKAREHKELLAKSEATARSLYDIGQHIVTATTVEEMFAEVKKELKKSFQGDFEIFFKQMDNGLNLPKFSELLTNEQEKGTALWVFENGKEAGWSTDTLPSSKNLYIPLKSFHEILGVLLFRPKTDKALAPDEKTFLYAVCRQLTGYLERSLGEEVSKQHEQLKQMENIHRRVLDRLSHEFEAPLKTAKGKLEHLKNKASAQDSQEDLKDIQEAEDSFEGLGRILKNISAMARLSHGTIPLNKHLQNPKELIEACCKSIRKAQSTHTINVILPESLPLVSFDFDLIHMLLSHLLSNAVAYSPQGSTVEVEAKTVGDNFVLSVTDEGNGIPPDQLDLIFEKFYRLPETASSPGAGLGLAIAKRIAEIHKGKLEVENLPGKGAKFSLTLPLPKKAASK